MMKGCGSVVARLPPLSRIRGLSMRQTSFATLVPILALAAGLTAGCGNSTSTTPSDTTSSSVVIDVYAGPIDPGGTTRYIVTLAADSTLQVMLAGEQLSDPTRTVSVPLQIDISDWDGSYCTPLDTNVTAPRLTAQLQRWLTAGSYCVQVSDPGTLAETVGAVVRISYPAPKLLPGTGSPVTLDSVVSPSGMTTKSFVTSREGDISITLNSAGPNGDTPVGLAIGVGGTDGGPCTLTRIVQTQAGPSPQITEHADAGIYCAAVIDPGTFTTAQNFSLTIAHP
jgi:hypothetical protein